MSDMAEQRIRAVEYCEAEPNRIKMKSLYKHNKHLIQQFSEEDIMFCSSYS